MQLIQLVSTICRNGQTSLYMGRIGSCFICYRYSGHLQPGEYENFIGQFLQDLVIFKCYINQYRDDGFSLVLGAKEGTKFFKY